MPRRGSKSKNYPTVSSIQKDEITEIAKKYWGHTIGRHKTYDPKIIDNLYEDELFDETYNKRKIVLLEFLQYLEGYLWPNFSENASDAHIMSIVIMLNEKFRERVPAWNVFIQNPTNFSLFFNKVMKLCLDEEKLKFIEHTALLTFLVNAVNSVEVDIVRKEIVKISSLTVLSNLFSSQRKALLAKSPKLLKYWNKLENKFSQLPPEQQEIQKFNRSFLWKMIQKCLKVLSFVDDETTSFDADAVKYLERFLEFCIDMVSLLTTRRFFNQLILSSNLLIRSTQSNLIKAEFGALFCKLIMRLKFYVRFEIDDVNGIALTENEMIQRHYDHVTELQKAAFKFFRQRMESFYLLSASSIDTPKVLTEKLSELSEDDLYNFAEYLHLVPTKNEIEEYKLNESYTKEFLIDVIVFHCERRPNQLQQLNEQPIYPSEKTIWDEDVVPYDEYNGDNVLSLPKLNFQFLTLHDYLLRNYLLYQMESTFEIRNDLEMNILRMRPWKHEHGGDKVVWGGWSKYALSITDFRFVKISKPLIGQKSPADVTADLTITLPQRKDLRQEWENLHRHDVLFLITVEALLPVGTKFDGRKSFNEQIRVSTVRGCEIDGLLDNDEKVIEEMEHKEVLKTLTGDVRKYRIWLDPNQYYIDQQNDNLDGYYTLNLVIRRDPKTNNFKAVLSTIRQLLNTDFVVPDWLQDLILGYGEPDSAHYTKLASPIPNVDFNDTFLSIEHLKNSFPENKLIIKKLKEDEIIDPGFKLTFLDLLPINEQKKLQEEAVDEEDGIINDKIKVEIYERYNKLEENKKRNKIKFTPKQIEAIKSGIEPGLTVIVGPPGTGKTDVAVQIISNIYHNWPEQRTLIVTHSNQALNQLFEKIINLDIDQRHLLRLGHGEENLETEEDFSRYGRVNYVLKHRLELLKEVEKLKDSLNEIGDVGYSCETAGQFYRFIICRLWDEFVEGIENDHKQIAIKFPFKKYFEDKKGKEIFDGENDLEVAKYCWKSLTDMFMKLEEFRSFELLRNGKDRTEYLLVKEAKIIAMTCTHAALKRKDLVELGFTYDNILMEESAQILEVETFIPLLLQDPNDGRNRLKRWIMIGDHHQLPPIIQNMTFQKYCNMEQSLFARFVRLGVPIIQLDSQGRARTEIAKLYNWRYKDLNDLEHVQLNEFQYMNSGFMYNYQLINVADFNGVGETTPSPYFYQNLGEAEYAVALFIYMRVLGYPAEKISILTTYNGQASLIQDIVNKKCGDNPIIGKPCKISTVDRYQGQQNDFIILSLVKTNHVGHLRDVRRLIVALSRARLGLYILGRVDLFRNCYELTPAFNVLCKRSNVLELLPAELYETKVLSKNKRGKPIKIVDTDHMVRFSHEFYSSNLELITMRYKKELAELKAKEEEKRKMLLKQQQELEEAMQIDGETIKDENKEKQTQDNDKNKPEDVATKKQTEESEEKIVFESVDFERLEEVPKY